VIVTPDHALLYNHRVVKPGRVKAPKMPATERALQATPQPEQQSRIIDESFVELIPK